MTISSKTLHAYLQDLLARYRNAGYFPAVAVRVFNRRETLAAACAGPVTEDAVFDVASLTKIATATQALLLMGQGKLDLHAPVARYFPEIAGDAALAGRLADVTLYRLLTHTSTLVDWYPFYARRGEDFFAVLKYALEHTEVSRGVCYSDLNFMLLGKLLEKVQGKPLAACLAEDLAAPLGLGTMVYHPDAALPLVPSCYGNDIEMDMCRERGIAFDGFRPLGQAVRGETNDGNAHYYFGDEAGHAGIFATAAAYEKLCQFYMNTEDPLLIEAQRDQEKAPGRGIGLQTGVMYPHGCGHTGFTGTSIYFSRTGDIGAVAMTNRLFFPRPSGLAVNDFRRALHEAVFALCAQNGR